MAIRVAKLDYFHLAQVSARLSGVPEVERIYRQACFNVALSMRDDHSKNFAFCMNPMGRWRLSPAFDLCPSKGPSGWHTMTVSDTAVDISRADVLRFADRLGLPEEVAIGGIEQARSASSQFESLAIGLGAQKAGTKAWSKVFARISKDLAPVSVPVHRAV